MIPDMIDKGYAVSTKNIKLGHGGHSAVSHMIDSRLISQHIIKKNFLSILKWWNRVTSTVTVILLNLNGLFYVNTIKSVWQQIFR